MTDNKSTIERLRLSGFKSIRQAEIDLGRLNVLIGANGAGKVEPRLVLRAASVIAQQIAATAVFVETPRTQEA